MNKNSLQGKKMEKRKKKKFSFKKLLIYIILTIGSIIMLFPFYWMVITSLKAPEETTEFPPTLIPKMKYYARINGEIERVKVLERIPPDKLKVKIITGLNIHKEYIINEKELIKKRWLWENYKRAWHAAPFPRYFLNSLIIAVSTTILQIITSLLAGFAFAKMKFKGKNILFMILIATLMIPGQVILIPNYVILAKLGWINTYYALIIPFAAQVFGIYFITQYIETLPSDLFDAAIIDGCSTFQILKEVVVPLSKAVILTTGLLTFVGSWNQLLWPLIVTNTPEMRPLQVGLAVFRQESGTNWELLTAAATFSLAPLLILFLFVQKHYIQGIARSGLK